jgi:Nucleoside 2-deoxyribosyltransferase like
MKIIYPPSKIETQNLSIFLAGTIDMGQSTDWQQLLIDTLEINIIGKEITVFNPRRKDWDSTWKQEITNPQFNEQVNWELDALEQADIVVMFLEAHSKSPVSMIEFGLYAGSGKLSVCCEEGFWRKGNIDIVCKRQSIPLVTTLKELTAALIRLINNHQKTDV